MVAPVPTRRAEALDTGPPPLADRDGAPPAPPPSAPAPTPVGAGRGELLGGLLLLLLLAVAARGLGRLMPSVPLAPLTLGLTLLLAPFLRARRVPGSLEPPHEVPLSVGMILLGVQLEPALLACLGPWAPLRLVFHWTVVLLLFSLAARLWKLPRRTLHLAALGLSGCGLSAVVSAARSDPTTRPAERDLALAATLTCGALGFVVMPVLAQALDLSPCALGTWAGLSMPTTAEAVLIGAAHGTTTLQIVGAWRLVVNLLQALPIVLWIRAHAPAPPGTSNRPLAVALGTVRRVPAFVWGLAVCGAFGFVGAFSAHERAVLSHVTSWAFLMALVGVGLRLKPRDLLRLGWKPVLACVLTWALAATLLLLATLPG